MVLHQFLSRVVGVSTFFHQVELFGIVAQSEWYIPTKAKYWHEIDSKQVPYREGKMQRTLKRELKST